MNPAMYFEVIADIRVTNDAKFNESTHNIQELYEQILNLGIKGIRKLVIELTEVRDYLFSPPVEMFPQVIITKKFDFAAYWARNEQERKVEILEIIYESVTDMCQKLNLDISPFTTAYQTLKKMSY